MSLTETEITENGVTNLEALPPSKHQTTVYVRGSFGAGTLTLGYIDTTGTFQAFDASIVAPLTAGFQVSLTPGPSVTLAASMAGSTSPSVFVAMTF